MWSKYEIRNICAISNKSKSKSISNNNTSTTTSSSIKAAFTQESDNNWDSRSLSSLIKFDMKCLLEKNESDQERARREEKYMNLLMQSAQKNTTPTTIKTKREKKASKTTSSMKKMAAGVGILDASGGVKKVKKEVDDDSKLV